MQLQFGDMSVSTKDLTRSFGWDYHDAFMQHDVQELNRVLVEKLEERMKVRPFFFSFVTFGMVEEQKGHPKFLLWTANPPRAALCHARSVGPSWRDLTP